MRTLKNLLAAGTLAATALFATQASAIVYSPYNAPGSPGLNVQSVTGGYVASYAVGDGQPESPANTNPSTIETFTETITGLSLTGATESKRCPGSSREGLGGFSGSNKACIGNVFTVKTNDDIYLIFVYAAALALDEFKINIVNSQLGRLSHLDVYNSAPSPVPVPPAALLLGSGIAGLAAARRKAKTAK